MRKAVPCASARSASGGRYDGLVARFRGEPVPATGISIGVSRLLAALQLLGRLDSKPEHGPVVVTVFDRSRVADYQRMVTTLRNAGIRAELYLGSGKMGPQLKYADKRDSPCVVIQGGDEKAKGEVQIKDLIEGAKAAAAIASNQEWRETPPGAVRGRRGQTCRRGARGARAPRGGVELNFIGAAARPPAGRRASPACSAGRGCSSSCRRA